MNFIKPLALTAALLLVAAPVTASPVAPGPAETATGEIVTAGVNGLVCDFCAQSIRKLFSREAAVSDVEVDLDKGVVRLSMKPGQTLDDAHVETLIRRSGYSLVSIDRVATP